MKLENKKWKDLIDEGLVESVKAVMPFSDEKDFKLWKCVMDYFMKKYGKSIDDAGIMRLFQDDERREIVRILGAKIPGFPKKK